MPKLIIKRNSEWASKMRSFELFINGVKISEIKDRQLISFEIPEGTYRLQARIDWCSSQPLDFELKKDEVKRVEVTGFIFSKYFFPAAIGSVLMFFGYRALYQKSSLFLAALLMVFFGYLLYFISIGRKHFLQLKER